MIVLVILSDNHQVNVRSPEVGDQPRVVGSPSWGSWVAIVWIVGDYHGNGGWPSIEILVTILGKVGDHISVHNL